MYENEKATVDYSPAPTGEIQPLNPKTATNVSQINMDFNGKFSQNRLKLINMG